MKYPGFCGSSYVSQSPVVASSRSVNWYPEKIELEGKVAVALYPTPGLRKLWDVGDDLPVRAITFDNNTLLAVIGSHLYELKWDFVLNPDGTVASLGTTVDHGFVSDDGKPATIAYNTVHWFIASGGLGFVWDGVTLTSVAGAFACVGFSDDYFLAIEPGTRNLKISEPLDGTTWGPLEFGVKEGDPGPVVGMLIDHGEVWLFGDDKIEGWEDSGNADFPFTRMPAARVEQGMIATASAARMDNSLVWVGGDKRGQGIVWRLDGYTPIRISNHAIEDAMKKWPTMTDIIGFNYVDGGHSYYVMSSPSGNQTWVYDASSKLWHERTYWDIVHGVEQRHRMQCHLNVREMHIVGDRQHGRVYWLTDEAFDDAGDAIRRVRRAPHLWNQGKRLFIGAFQVQVENGLGLETGLGSDPKVMWRHSWDGGKTWSAERMMSAGPAGLYGQRLCYRSSLGSGRDFVPEISMTDPIPWRVIDGVIPDESFTVGLS